MYNVFRSLFSLYLVFVFLRFTNLVTSTQVVWLSETIGVSVSSAIKFVGVASLDTAQLLQEVQQENRKQEIKLDQQKM